MIAPIGLRGTSLDTGTGPLGCLRTSKGRWGHVADRGCRIHHAGRWSRRHSPRRLGSQLIRGCGLPEAPVNIAELATDRAISTMHALETGRRPLGEHPSARRVPFGRQCAGTISENSHRAARLCHNRVTIAEHRGEDGDATRPASGTVGCVPSRPV